ncbi:hypothetical protein BRC93_06715 [Halobacteriales archaeon QS_5_70_15]|nr:MAG: hypothetical protein BRC93_06715 [Halobacteriales archaeon QS_5_70_15]
MGVRSRVPFRHRASTRAGLGTVAAGLAGPVVGFALAGLDGRLVPTGDPLSRLTAGVVLYGLGLVAVAVGYLALTGRTGLLRRVSLLLVAALSLLVIAPTEELLYRGAVQASLYDVTSRPWAVVIASVPFTLAHVPTLYVDTAEPSAIALSLTAIFGLSLVFGWLHARSDDLLVPVAVHGAYNAVVFCLIYLAGV